MAIDPAKGLVWIYLVQHAGFPPGGEKGWETFQDAVQRLFGANG